MIDLSVTPRFCPMRRDNRKSPAGTPGQPAKLDQGVYITAHHMIGKTIIISIVVKSDMIRGFCDPGIGFSYLSSLKNLNKPFSFHEEKSRIH